MCGGVCLSPVKFVLPEPGGHMVGNDVIVFIGHQKMRISPDADFGQFHQSSMAAMPVDGLHKFASHLQTYAPVFPSKLIGDVFRNIISEVEDDGDLGELVEFLRRNGDPLHRAGEAGHVFGNLPFREDVGARFQGNDAAHFRVADVSQPGNPPAE